MLAGSRRITRPALFLQQACWVSSKTFDCKRSAAARKRNHVARGTRRAYSAFRLPRSSTIQLKPPACRSRSVTRNPCSSRDHDLRVGTIFLCGVGNWVSCGPGCLGSGRCLCSASAQRGAASAEPSRSPTASRKAFDFHPRMTATRLGQYRFWLGWLFCHARQGRSSSGGPAAAYPKQPRKIHSNGRRRFRVQGVGNVYPGAHLAGLGHTGYKCERKRSASGTFRSNNLADGAYRQSSVQQGIDLANPCGHNGVGDTR